MEGVREVHYTTFQAKIGIKPQAQIILEAQGSANILFTQAPQHYDFISRRTFDQDG